MDLIIEFFRNRELSLLAAFLLGVLVAVCPCTMATNVTVLTGVLGKSGRTGMRGAFYYVLGRSVSFFLLGCLLYLFSDITHLGDWMRQAVSVFGKILGPLFIVIGVLMLDIIHLHGISDRCVLWGGNLMKKRTGGLFALGLLLAFAFCPYSAALYFGATLPLALYVQEGVKFLVPFVFALGAGVPVMMLAWLLAKGFDAKDGRIAKFMKLELWFRRILAILFIVSGVLFVIEYYFHAHH